jgi:hypothetical protein
VILRARWHVADRERPQAMKTKSVLGSCILALLAVASVAAYGQMKTTEIADAQNAEYFPRAKTGLGAGANFQQ